jgi:5'-nucleotidase
MSKPLILVSNDDGVYSRGIRCLEKRLRDVADVIVVAPLEEKSTTGHHLTLHKPVRLKQIEEEVYATTGGPADCVQLALGKVLSQKPDLMVSGVNRGSNLGQDVFYSGTVSAAREAAIAGIPSIAVSVQVGNGRQIEEEDIYFETGVEAVLQVMEKLAWQKMPTGSVLNINAPSKPWSDVKGSRFAKLGRVKYSHEVEGRIDHRGQPYYWIGGQHQGFELKAETDTQAVQEGYIAITPLQLDCTDHDYGRMIQETFR